MKRLSKQDWHNEVIKSLIALQRKGPVEDNEYSNVASCAIGKMIDIMDALGKIRDGKVVEEVEKWMKDPLEYDIFSDENILRRKNERNAEYGERADKTRVEWIKK